MSTIRGQGPIDIQVDVVSGRVRAGVRALGGTCRPVSRWDATRTEAESRLVRTIE